MRMSFAYLLAAWTVAAPAMAQATSPREPEAHGDLLRPRLEARLAAAAEALDGEMGYCVVDLTSGTRLSRHGDRAFPTASTIKIAVLYELLAQADERRLRLDDVRPLAPAARVAGAGVLQHLEAPALSLADHATLMIMLSDNSATNVVIDAVGLDAVTARMRGLGLGRIWLQRRMMDAAAARAGRENLASPCDIADLLRAIHESKGLSPAARERALATLRKPKSTPFTKAVPPGVTVASKPGGLEGVAVDAALVDLPGRPYIVVGMTNWLAAAADGDRALELLGRAVHSYFVRVSQGGAYGRMTP